MDVFEAVDSRISCRAFFDKPVDQKIIRDLLARAARALAPGGRVVVSDFVLEDDGTAPRQAVLFSINMLVGTPSGRSYRESEYRSWLTAAGLAGIERVRLPGPAHLLIGRKPSP